MKYRLHFVDKSSRMWSWSTPEASHYLCVTGEDASVVSSMADVNGISHIPRRARGQVPFKAHFPTADESFGTERDFIQKSMILSRANVTT